MFCPKCGSQIEDNATVCPNCGHQVDSFNSSTPSGSRDVYSSVDNGQSVTAIILGAIGLIAAWLIALAGYILGGIALTKALKVLKYDKSSPKAIVGLILAIVTLVFSLVNSVLGILIQFGVITL